MREDGQVYPRAPPEPAPAPGPASLIPAAPATRTRWSRAQRFPEVAPEACLSGSGSAAKRPHGTKGESKREAGRAPAQCWPGRWQGPWENDPGVTTARCLMGEAGEALRTDRESAAACGDQRYALQGLTLLQPSPLRSFLFFLGLIIT